MRLGELSTDGVTIEVPEATSRFRAYTVADLDGLTARAGLSARERLEVRAVAQVLPFRVNQYVVDELIDWGAAPDDPMYRLVFPQADMLPADDVGTIARLLEQGASRKELNAAATLVRHKLNPHPAGQLTANKPSLDGEDLDGFQHKYDETVLFFPRQGQTCHAYCTYCFRWAQFVGEPDLKMSSSEVDRLVAYVEAHPEVTSVLITGGDPMIMTQRRLDEYVEPLLGIEHLESIRIGTKALGYWPQRFVTDADAEPTLRLFERVVASGKNLALMAHYTHPVEMEPAITQDAVRRIRATGAVIRTQAPLIRTINDDADTWSSMWRTQVRQGMVPYYMFVERDTGPQDYFSVPLGRAYEIYRDAFAGVSGLARTVRGPSMSADPGKVCVDGVVEIFGEKVFALRMLQARDPSLVGRPFYAAYDEAAIWLSDLKPALGADRFPFDPMP